MSFIEFYAFSNDFSVILFSYRKRYSAMLYGRSIKLADELGLRPTGNTREMQDDFEFRKQMIKQKALIRPV